jgi:hypothetical protein
MFATYLILNILFVLTMFIKGVLPLFFEQLLIYYYFFWLWAVHVIVFLGCLIYELVRTLKKKGAQEREAMPLFMLILLGVAIVLNLITAFMFWHWFAESISFSFGKRV